MTDSRHNRGDAEYTVTIEKTEYTGHKDRPSILQINKSTADWTF